jgi:hypothetical protein
MAIITIKTSQGNSAPTSLANGELAYSYSSNKLFIGQTTTAGSPVSVEYIGGKLLVDKVANLENIVLTGGGTITTANVLITDAIKFDTGAYTTNGLLYAKSSGVVDFVVGSTTGKVLQVAANGAPVFDDLNGGTF